MHNFFKQYLHDKQKYGSMTFKTARAVVILILVVNFNLNGFNR